MNLFFKTILFCLLKGCYFHGHDPQECPITRHIKDKEWQETREKRQERTRKKREFTESLGITYNEIYECEYKKLLREKADLRQFAQDRQPSFYRQTRGRQSVTCETILNGVLNDDLFGAVLVDIHVPKELHDKFSEFAPLFVTTSIPWEVIGDSMQQHWRDTQIFPDGEVRPFDEKTMLVGGMRAVRVLIATPLLKFYLEQGLVVDRVYEVYVLF